MLGSTQSGSTRTQFHFVAQLALQFFQELRPEGYPLARRIQ
jgi:hypothetical protein